MDSFTETQIKQFALQHMERVDYLPVEELKANAIQSTVEFCSSRNMARIPSCDSHKNRLSSKCFFYIFLNTYTLTLSQNETYEQLQELTFIALDERGCHSPQGRSHIISSLGSESPIR